MQRAKSCAWLVAGALVCICGRAATAQDAKPVKELKVELKNSKGEPAGSAVLKQKKDGVQVKVSVKNIAFGDHGVHIHQNQVAKRLTSNQQAVTSIRTASSMDSRILLAITRVTHPAISVGEDHMGSATWTLTGVTLQPGAPNSLLSNGGTSLVVHEHADDMKTDPSGNSGNRIACGVIKQ